jgi:hypothetical protein
MRMFKPAESAPVHSLEDIIVWPCGTWCYREELSQMNHMSDDYIVLWYGSAEYNAFDAS